MNETGQRAELLRSYETDCYSISLYLLQNEQLAVRAATEALRTLLGDDRFYAMGELDRKRRMRQAAEKSSIRIYAEHLSG